MMTLQDDVEVIKQTLESVLRENQRLHLKVEQTDATDAPYNMTEWCAPPSPSLPHSLLRACGVCRFFGRSQATAAGAVQVGSGGESAVNGATRVATE